MPPSRPASARCRGSGILVGRAGSADRRPSDAGSSRRRRASTAVPVIARRRVHHAAPARRRGRDDRDRPRSRRRRGQHRRGAAPDGATPRTAPVRRGGLTAHRAVAAAHGGCSCGHRIARTGPSAAPASVRVNAIVGPAPGIAARRARRRRLPARPLRVPPWRRTSRRRHQPARVAPAPRSPPGSRATRGH